MADEQSGLEVQLTFDFVNFIHVQISFVVADGNHFNCNVDLAVTVVTLVHPSFVTSVY